MFILFQSQMNWRMVKPNFFSWVQGKAGFSEFSCGKRLTLYYKELVKCHGSTVLDTQTF